MQNGLRFKFLHKTHLCTCSSVLHRRMSHLHPSLPHLWSHSPAQRAITVPGTEITEHITTWAEERILQYFTLQQVQSYQCSLNIRGALSRATEQPELCLHLGFLHQLSTHQRYQAWQQWDTLIQLPTPPPQLKNLFNIYRRDSSFNVIHFKTKKCLQMWRANITVVYLFFWTSIKKKTACKFKSHQNRKLTQILIFIYFKSKHN